MKPPRHREWSRFDPDRVAEWVIVGGTIALLVAFILGVRP